MIPIKTKLFPRGTLMYYKSVRGQDDIRKTVEFSHDGEKIILNEDLLKILQDEIDKFINQDDLNCLLFYHDIPLVTPDGKKIPRQWIKDIMSQIDIVPLKYNPYVKEGDMYADLSEEMEYDVVNGELNILIADEIVRLYEQGYNTSISNIKDGWSLEESKQGLYKPSWDDLRFANNISDFLIERSLGKQTISLRVAKNNVVRHNIARFLLSQKHNFFFTHNNLEVESSDLKMSRQIASAVEQITADSTGRTLIFNNTKLSWIKVYNYISSKMLSQGDCVVYLTRAIEIQYTLSCLVPINTNTQFFEKEIGKRSIRAFSRLIDKFPNQDIHKLIEDPNFSVRKNLS
jgi:hypothetical protein